MKKAKYWTTRTQVALLFTGVAVLIVINFLTIYQSNRITRKREATAQLVQEAVAQINQMGFYASNIANGADQYKDVLGQYIEQLEGNMQFLEKGGVINQNERELRLAPLPEDAYNAFSAFQNQWATYKASLNKLEQTESTVETVFTYPEARDVITDSGTYVTQYIPTSRTFVQPNPEIETEIDKVATETGSLATKLEELRDLLNDYFWQNRFWFQVATVLFSILSIIGLVIAFSVLIRNLFDPLAELQHTTDKIAEGDLDCRVPEAGYGEISNLAAILNRLLGRLVTATSFATKIGNGEFTSEFHVASDEDQLGYALLEMRDNLKKVDEEDQKRNWANEGMAKFGDILRSNFDSEEELAYSIVANLVDYLDINQGGLFTKEEEADGTQNLKLLAAYAFSRRKYMDRELEVGEGLIGQAVLEGEVIYLTEVPEDYALIQSGMGEGHPRSVVILPLKLNDEIYGALELASFDLIEEYQVEFLKKISESITSTLATSRTNQRTKLLLEDSQQMTEEMKAQEEEMRQNMEELQATQEEMARKQKELAANDHRFRQMTQNVPGMLMQLRMEANGSIRFLFVSSASQEMLGLHPDEVTEAPDHEEVLKLVPEDIDSYRKAILTSAQELTPFRWEGRILGADGKTVHWMSIAARPEADEDDRILWNGLITDITDKKQAEEKMRVMIKQMEAKDRQVNENIEVLEQTKEELQFMNREMGAIMNSIEASILMFELNKDLKIRKINENLLKELGTTEKALMRKEFQILFDASTVESSYFEQLQEMLQKGGFVETYVPLKSSTGSSQWVHFMFFATMSEKGTLLKIAGLGSPLPEDLIPVTPIIL